MRRDASEPEKQARAAEWVGRLWEDGVGRLSYQVLSEYYVTLTRKLDPPRPIDDAREDVEALQAWDPVGVDRSTIEAAWSVQHRFGYAWWDALIVAAAVNAGSRHLLTEDLQEGQEIDGVTVMNPFLHRPDEILGDARP